MELLFVAVHTTVFRETLMELLYVVMLTIAFKRTLTGPLQSVEVKIVGQDTDKNLTSIFLHTQVMNTDNPREKNDYSRSNFVRELVQHSGSGVVTPTMFAG